MPLQVLFKSFFHLQKFQEVSSAYKRLTSEDSDDEINLTPVSTIPAFMSSLIKINFFFLIPSLISVLYLWCNFFVCVCVEFDFFSDFTVY